MNHDFKTYQEIKQYFKRACQIHKPCEVILFNNQSDIVSKLFSEVAQETDRIFVNKDLTTLQANELGTMKLESALPKWLFNAFDGKEGKACIIYLSEFHLAPRQVQTNVLNILIKKDVEGIKFPMKTLVVLGVRKEDEAAEGLTHTHTIKFYK